MAGKKKPEPLKRGPKWLRKAFEDRDAYREALKVVAGKNVSLQETESGTVISQTVT